MNVYDHLSSIFVLDGIEVNDWADAADAISISQDNPTSALTEGIGQSQVVFSNKKSQTVVIKVLQNGATNKRLRALHKKQSKGSSYKPISGSYQDIINGDSITLIGGTIQAPSAFVRGNAHNDGTWTIVFSRAEFN